MSLRNLKSAFSDFVRETQVEGRHTESPTTVVPFVPSSVLEATTYAYNSITDEPIDLDGGMAPINFPLLTDLFNNPETTTSLNDSTSNINFQVGLGFPSPNMKAVVSGEGFQASVSYIKTATGDVLAASGAVTKLGKLSDLASNIGIDTPTFDFGADISSLLDGLPTPPEPQFLKYENTVEELFNLNGGNLTDDFANTGDIDSTRGIIYQVLGNQNKAGLTPDFSFQDKVQNIANVEYINPIAGFNAGNIEFKDDYFEDIGQSLGGLASALTPDFIEDGLKFLSENEKIRNLFSGIGGVFENIGGFGKRLPQPKFPKIDIDFSKIGNFFKGGSGLGGGFLGDLGNNISKLAQGVGNTLGSVADTIKDVGGPIAQSAKELASNLNPLDEFTLPQIQLQNPRQTSVTEYGGQAIFKQNTPRALSREISLRTTSPVETADRAYVENDVSTPYAKLGEVRYTGVVNVPKAYYPNASMDEKAGGDKMTLADVKGPSLSAYDDATPNFVDSVENGMPFFFKDLRNNTFIIFRGYIEGITDNPSPNWSEQNYIGRSESNWVYTGTSREISFNFKLAAQTAVELDSIYLKVNKLTGMVYPEYMVDQFLQTGGNADNPQFKVRMKPPLARLRIGDLFGNPSGVTRDGILGFIKSISYTWPDESPWETRHGQRVPKFCDVSIGWQVIHERVPDMNYPFFYGYNPDREEARNLLNQSNQTAEELAALGG